MKEVLTHNEEIIEERKRTEQMMKQEVEKKIIQDRVKARQEQKELERAQ